VESLVEKLLDEGQGDSFKIPSRFKSARMNCDEIKLKDEKQATSLKKKGNLIGRIVGSNKDDYDAGGSAAKLVIFYIGGIGYNEIRGLRNLDKLKDRFITVIGSTNLVAPKDYVEGILKMNPL